MKVMTIVGTRPELIKMSRVIAELDLHTSHVLVHTGQNHDYELNQIFFEELGIRKPDYFLGVSGANASQVIAQVIAKSDEVIASERPDALALYGDTNSCLSVLPAKRRKVPTFHMEAGNRCFDQRVPEELNRKIIDHLADINLVLTEHARRYLLAEGIRPETIIKTGSHMREVLNFYKPQIEKSNVVARLGLAAGQYFVVSAHREENVDSSESLSAILSCLRALVDKYDYPVIVSTHPRTRKRLEAIDALRDAEKITFCKPFGFFDYIKLQMSAFCSISDSGTITEEASILRLPAITIRETHERPEGMDAGVLVMSSLRPVEVLAAVDLVTNQFRTGALPPLRVDDYENDCVSSQVVRIILSYVSYVNRVVWAK